MHRFLLGSSLVTRMLLGRTGLDIAQDFVSDKLNDLRSSGKNEYEHGGRTFVQILFDNQKKNPDSITDREVKTHAFGNITAGADTTTIALRTILFHIGKNQDVYHILCHEIRDSAKLTLPISFHSAKSLPYLNAVIQEALRIHPPNGLMYSRETAAEGSMICGHYIPKGTEVGISPWVVHYDPALFPNPEKFEPERWLCPDAELLARRNRSLFAFSAGHHTCSGRNIALMEVTKLIPSLLIKYDIRLVDPKAKLSFKNRWFAPQKGLIVTLDKRE